MPANKPDVLRFLKHNEIDFQCWDRCIENAENGNVYSVSWFLDVVGGTWDALVFGDYQFVMAVPNRTKYGIRYVFQPYFCQQLGIFPSAPTHIQQLFADKLHASFRYVKYQFNPALDKQAFSGFVIADRRNRLLSLATDYPGLMKNYSGSNLRNIKKASRFQTQICNDLTISEFLQLKKDTLKTKVPENSFEILNQLMQFTIEHKTGEIFAARSETGEITSAQFFVRHGKKVYSLSAFSTPKGMEQRAAFAIIDYYCKKNAGTGLVIDFEGSMHDGIDDFYSGFGAQKETYFELSLNRLPGIIKLFK